MTDPRIKAIMGDKWIGFPRAELVLQRLRGLIDAPRLTRMPGLVVYGASGIGKTMIAHKMMRDYPPEYNSKRGVTSRPLLLLQAPPAPDERRFYLHILSSIDAPVLRSQTIGELEVRVISYLRELAPKMIMIDEVHNLLAGSAREQRRFINVLRYLSNELQVSLVCFGVTDAVTAIRGDVQLARRLDEHHLPNWRDDIEFTELVSALIAAMPLKQPSELSVKALRQILAKSDGVTAIIVAMIKQLAIRAVENGEECITDEAVADWRPPYDPRSASKRVAAA